MLPPPLCLAITLRRLCRQRLRRLFPAYLAASVVSGRHLCRLYRPCPVQCHHYSSRLVFDPGFGHGFLASPALSVSVLVVVRSRAFVSPIWSGSVVTVIFRPVRCPSAFPAFDLSVSFRCCWCLWSSMSGLVPILVPTLPALFLLGPSLVHSQHILPATAPHTALSSAVSWWASLSGRASTGSLCVAGLHSRASCTTLPKTRLLSLTAFRNTHIDTISHKHCFHSCIPPSHRERAVNNNQNVDTDRDGGEVGKAPAGDRPKSSCSG